MAVTKLTMSGFKPSTYNKYDDFLAGNAAYDPAATWLIASATGTGSSNTITFSSIPSTYTSLQIRGSFLDVTGGQIITMRFNGDTGTNYAAHDLYGLSNGTVAADGYASASSFYVQELGTRLTYPSPAIVDIHNYASTTQYKTARVFSGIDANSATQSGVELGSGLWMNTAAINSISIICTANFATTTKVSLYGMIGS